MRFLRYSLLVSAVCIGFGSSAASAEEVFQWQAPHTQFSAAFPDDWRQTSAEQPDDVLTIMGPGVNDYASCRLRQHEDRRFLIYPRSDAAAIQHTAYNVEFWKSYMGQYDGAVMNEGHDDAGLGKGFGTYADISFVSPAGPQVQKRGIVLATVYNGKAYMFECSSETHAFDKWNHTFLDILKSVDFRGEYAPAVNGNYRPFQDDGDLRIWGNTPIDTVIY